MRRPLRFFFCYIFFICLALAASLGRTRYEYKANPTFKGLTLKPKHTLTCVDAQITTVQRKFENWGNFFVVHLKRFLENAIPKYSSGLGSLYMVGLLSFLNKGSFVFDGLNSHVSPIIKISSEGKFINRGKIFFGTGGQLYTPHRYTCEIEANRALENYGIIMFSRHTSREAKFRMSLVRSGTKSLKIKNYGVVCLFNSVWVVENPIYGSGCIDVGGHSTVEISGQRKPHPDQIFHLLSSSLVLKIQNIPLEEAGVQLTVIGLLTSNYIQFGCVMKDFDYSSKTGVVRFSPNFGIYSIYIWVGHRYNPNFFRLERNRFQYLSSHQEPHLLPQCNCPLSYPMVSLQPERVEPELSPWY